MKINIGHSISEFLKFEKQVSIPGLGSFQIQQTVQGFQLGERKILPPVSSIVFLEETRNDQLFPEFVKRKYQISRKKAEKAIKRFSTRILNNLLNLGRATINGLGHLERNKSKKLVFFPQPDSGPKENYGLPEISIYPITRSFEEKRSKFSTVAHSSSSKIAAEHVKVNKKEAFPPILLFLIFIILLFLLAWWFVYQNNPGDISDPVIAAEEKENLTAEDEADIEKIIEEFYEEKSDREAVQPSESESDLLNEEVSEIIDTEITTTTEDLTPAKKEDSGSSAEKAMVDEEKITSEALPGVLNLDYVDPVLKEYKDVITSDALNIGCVIVVGSFKNKKNAYRLRDQMMRKGYNVYTEQYNEWTRIGLLFNCKDKDLVENIQSIRRNIEKMAWYLIPEFSVPRE